MDLDAGPLPLTDLLARLEPRGPSVLSVHDDDCCRDARAWFVAAARAEAARAPGPPAWLRDRWRWGPVDWPLTWCRAVAAPALDCGALAALAREAVAAGGGVAAPVQLLERFDPGASANWRARWRAALGVAPWTWDDLAYHEAVALLDAGHLRLWDPTDALAIEPHAPGGYGTVVALRIAPTPGTPDHLPWLGRNLPVGPWVPTPPA